MIARYNLKHWHTIDLVDQHTDRHQSIYCGNDIAFFFLFSTALTSITGVGITTTFRFLFFFFFFLLNFGSLNSQLNRRKKSIKTSKKENRKTGQMQFNDKKIIKNYILASLSTMWTTTSTTMTQWLRECERQKSVRIKNVTENVSQSI